MNRRDFEKILNSAMKDFSIDEKVELLDKMNASWIPKIKEEKLKNYCECPNCNKYYLISKFQFIKEIEMNTEERKSCISGGKTEYYTYEQLVTYMVCPGCGKSHETIRV